VEIYISDCLPIGYMESTLENWACYPHLWGSADIKEIVKEITSLFIMDTPL